MAPRKKCPHGKRKDRCRECGGKSFCVHNKRKSLCVSCGGSELCNHNKEKHKCRECKGSSFCVHDIRKNYCKICGGASLCEHGRQKQHCTDCDGVSICEHGARKYRCILCKGTGICEHEREKSKCVLCGGSELCEHHLVRFGCGVCTPYKCEDCGLYKAPKNKDGNRLCATCNPYSKTVSMYDENRAEMKVNKFLSELYPAETFPIGTYAPFRSCGDKKKPDTIMLFLREKHAFIIETDENYHKGYEPKCEWEKILNHSQSLHQSFELDKITIIRFNPDVWKVNEITTRFYFKERVKVLHDLIIKSLNSQDNSLYVFHLFYPVETKIENPILKNLAVRQSSQKEINNWIKELIRDYSC